MIHPLFEAYGCFVYEKSHAPSRKSRLTASPNEKQYSFVRFTYLTKAFIMIEYYAIFFLLFPAISGTEGASK